MGVICNQCQACLEENNKRNRPINTSSQGRGNRALKVNVSHSGGGSGGDKGSSCYSCSAQINQRPEVGRDDFRIQINAQHHGDHSCDEQTLTIIFNHPATFISCSNGSLNSGNNTTKIQVKLRYHNNANDNIGMGDFIVKSTHSDLKIVKCFINDGH